MEEKINSDISQPKVLERAQADPQASGQASERAS